MAWFEHGTSRIYYEETGSGTPVLLLPGFSGSIEEFGALRTTLATSYRVIAADPPGSGRSEPQPRAYPATYYEDDSRSVVALLQHLATGPTHLLGYSDGGEVELLMAAFTPEIARSLVTWGAAGALSEAQRPVLDAIDTVIDTPVESLQGFSDYLKTRYGEANARVMTHNVVGAWRAIIEGGGDISLSKAGSITCPVLLIAGEHDPFATPALLSQLAARLRTASILEVEGVGHGVYDERPEWLTQTILDWLKRH